jgi:hypothetical protein
MELLLDQRWGGSAHHFRQRLPIANRLINLSAVNEVIGECGVNFRQRKIMLRGNGVYVQSHALVPDGYVLNRDPVPGNARLATRYAGGNFNKPVKGGCGQQGCSFKRDG